MIVIERDPWISHRQGVICPAG